jgi:hypothetical protein
MMKITRRGQGVRLAGGILKEAEGFVQELLKKALVDSLA